MVLGAAVEEGAGAEESDVRRLSGFSVDEGNSMSAKGSLGSLGSSGANMRPLTKREEPRSRIA